MHFIRFGKNFNNFKFRKPTNSIKANRLKNKCLTHVKNPLKCRCNIKNGAITVFPTTICICDQLLCTAYKTKLKAR